MFVEDSKKLDEALDTVQEFRAMAVQFRVDRESISKLDLAIQVLGECVTENQARELSERFVNGTGSGSKWIG